MTTTTPPCKSRLCEQMSCVASTGIGTSFFPTQRGFGHSSVDCEPVPVDPTQLIKLFDSCLPEFEEQSRFHPRLKAIVRSRMRT